MVTLIIGLLVCVGIAVAVVGLVAIPARREGRDMLTTRGEDLVATLRERTEDGLGALTPGSSRDGSADQSRSSGAGPAEARTNDS